MRVGSRSHRWAGRSQGGHIAQSPYRHHCRGVFSTRKCYTISSNLGKKLRGAYGSRASFSDVHSNGLVVVLSTKRVIHHIEIEVELPHILGMESRSLEFNDNISVKQNAIEDEVSINVLFSHLEVLLLSNESQAITHFEMILRHMCHKLSLNISLIHRFCLPHQIKDVEIFHQIVGKVTL